MVRAMLRDDYNGPFRENLTGVSRVRLDDDGRSSVPAGIGHVPAVPGVEHPGGRVNPLIAVRERIQDGYSESGNQLWTWIDIVEQREAVGWTSRTEVDDDANTSTVIASFEILYDKDLPSPRESATIRTEADGLLWDVTALERFPDRVRFEVARIDDAA